MQRKDCRRKLIEGTVTTVALTVLQYSFGCTWRATDWHLATGSKLVIESFLMKSQELEALSCP